MMPEAASWAVKTLVFLVGLALGSFLNVVITRLPRGEGVWGCRSRCPSCRTTLPWRDNVPLASYLLLKGRCRFCGAWISWRYPAVELAAGLLALALWQRFPPGLLPVYGPFCAALLALSAIDLEHRVLPDVLTLPGIVLGLLLSLVFPHLTFLQSAAGALLGAAIFSGVAWVYRRLAARRGLTGDAALGMGFGDVKLLAFIGAFLGAEALPLVIFVSAALGSLAGVVLVLAGRRRAGGERQEAGGGRWRYIPVPYGPFLALAALVYLFGGGELLRLAGGGN
jgi:leader peptidase (prepilin peptidase)/N-methyltransferase